MNDRPKIWFDCSNNVRWTISKIWAFCAIRSSAPMPLLYLERLSYQFNICHLSSDDLPGGFVFEDPAVVVGSGEFGCGFFVQAEDGGGVELERGGGVH
jgi:hypothetical protein